VLLSVVLINPSTGWVMVGIIYQVTLSMKPKSPLSTMMAANKREAIGSDLLRKT
jgi:hypothetical protein